MQSPNSTISQCCALCTTHTPRCQTFVFNNNTANCFLMDNTRPGVRQGPEMTTGCVNASCAPPPPPPRPPPGPPCADCANIVFFITGQRCHSFFFHSLVLQAPAYMTSACSHSLLMALQAPACNVMLAAITCLLNLTLVFRSCSTHELF